MDGLNPEERALAWKACWHPSFVGIAIVDKDFRFRSVNPQFQEIVGVSPGELIGMRFQDITPPAIRALDEKNARLVMDGIIESYLLPKSYEFSSGKKVDIVLLVRGVYSEKGEFLFFVSRIMLDETPKDLSNTQNQKQTVVLGFIKEYGKLLVAAGAFIGGLIIALLEYVSNAHK